MPSSLRNFDFGIPVAPLDILIAPRGDGDPSSAALNAKLHRLIANGRMQRFRAVPLARRAWFVTLTATETEESSFEPGQLVVGLEYQPQQFWVHARRVARTFLKADREAGGHGSAFAVEYRHCKVCGRALLAADAATYRQRERWPIKTWQYPQGPACSLDCKPIIIRNSKNRRKIQ